MSQGEFRLRFFFLGLPLCSAFSFDLAFGSLFWLVSELSGIFGDEI